VAQNIYIYAQIPTVTQIVSTAAKQTAIDI